MVFKLVAVAGTFDHLHEGHKRLLKTAKKSGKEVIVGLCRKSMLANKAYPQSLESYPQRRRNLKAAGFHQIVPLVDIYGPAAVSAKIEAVVCSPLSRANAEKISQVRKKPLKIIEVPLVKDTDGQPLSSTQIRRGLINRQGFFYPQVFENNLFLPPALRQKLKQPFARLVKKIAKPRFMTIAVGDIAAASLIREKIKIDLAIVDLKTRRRKIFSGLKSLGLPPGLTSTNPASTINSKAVQQILKCLKDNYPTLLIDGEEDLLVLPAVLLSPLKTTVFYGQPDQGLVKITVSEASKTKALKLLRQFTLLKTGPKLP